MLAGTLFRTVTFLDNEWDLIKAFSQSLFLLQSLVIFLVEEGQINYICVFLKLPPCHLTGVVISFNILDMNSIPKERAAQRRELLMQHVPVSEHLQ